MKTAKLLVLFLFISTNAMAQCYSKIVSRSRNYIALQTDGTLWAKGTGLNGFLGFGNNNPVAEFTQIGLDNDWTDKISLNGISVFAIKTDGTLWVWGNNYPNGAAGIGSFDLFGPFGPTQVGTDTDWDKVAAGYSFTIAVKTNGTLWAWGSNDKGQLGIGNPDDLYKTNVPIQVGTDTDWTAVFTGVSQLAYGIKTDGTLWSWGNFGNYIGYTGANLNNSYRSPHQIGADTWKTITVTGFGPMTTGIKTDGSLWGWGLSNFQTYYFGNGTDSYSSQVPERIGTGNDWKEIWLSEGTTLGLKTAGTRWGWGRNSLAYQLGMGTGFTSDVTIVTQLDSDSDWKTLSIDQKDGLGDGIRQNNSLFHWGSNHQGPAYPSPTLFSNSNCTLGIKEFSLNPILVSPNPTKEVVTVRFNEKPEGSIEVLLTNTLGQTILSKHIEINNGELSLNLRQLPSGIYCISLKSSGSEYLTKIIKN